MKNERLATLLLVAEGDWKTTMTNLVAAGPARGPNCGPVQAAPEASWGTGSEAPVSPGSRALAFVNSVGSRLLRPMRQTCRAIYQRPVRLLGHVKGRWRRRSLSRKFDLALLALGQRMYACGIDDGELGER